MKLAFVLALLITVELHGQGLADVARMERKRQAAVEAAVKVETQGDHNASKKAPDAEEPQKPEVEEQADDKVSIEKKLQQERVDMVRERSALLVKLDEMKNDPEAAKAIELQLIEVTKRNEELKLRYLSTQEKSENPPAPAPPAASPGK